MDNYINKDELIKTVCKEYQGCMNTFFAKPNDFVTMIEDAPIIVLAQERVAHWERGNIFYSLFGLVKCSACGHANEKTFYCPLCGARMDTERSSNNE